MDCTIQADGGISFSPSPLPSPSREREKNRAEFSSIGPLSLQEEGEKQSRTQFDRPSHPSRKREKNRAELSSIGPLSLQGEGWGEGNIQPLTQPQKQKALHAGRAS